MDGARSLFALRGPLVRELLATILPLDLHPRAFPPGAAAATLGAHLPLLLWLDGETFHLSCARSYGDSLAAALQAAGRGRNLRVRDAVRYSPAPAAG
nr:sarcosine oxidase subunit gamma family protein [Falsiroseomonas tokyonensis]